MMVIPAIDLMDGRCVQLVGGDPRTMEAMSGSPVEIAKKWEAMGASRLHVIDLDAALGRGDNESAVREIIEATDASVQVGGGVRTEEKAERLFDAGASEVIVGTRAIMDPEWLEGLSHLYPEKIIVAVDARGDEISVKGWTGGSGMNLYSYVKRIEALPIYGLLYTNIDVEGQLKGMDLEPVNRLAGMTGKRLFVAGGITTVEDIERLADAGAYGAVLGMSIYKGTIDLREALRRCGK
jgi:phosphoribosylformimino-5-aminoimidazole carboxamide ribotide isomerase